MIEKLVDLGTKKIEVNICGTGRPVVVIETGMGCSFYDWCKVICEISKITTVLTYHRAGYGESTLVRNEERSTKQIAEDLNKLLQIEGINSPIILVGHSFGGLCVQHFASLFSEKVLGMVLVDSNSVDEEEMDKLRDDLQSFRDTFSKDRLAGNWKELSLKSKIQLETLISPKLLPQQLEFTDEIQKSILKFQVNPNMYSAMASELILMSQSGQEIKKCLKILKVPLKVLGRDCELAVKWDIDMGIQKNEAIKFETLWQRLVIEETKKSTKGQFMEIKGSRHSIYRTNPEVVVKAINDVIDESRLG